MPVAVTVLERQKLVYVHTPKVASTSLIAATHRFAGLPAIDKNPRKLGRQRKYMRILKDLGLKMRRVDADDLRRLRDELSDYIWFGATRDPLKRIVSGYHSKVHRYAKHFDPAAYRKGQWGQLREGLKAIDDSRYVAKHVALQIPFSEMLQGLKRHGVGFDPHFELQCNILALDDIDYDMLLRQEHLEEDLRELCRKADLPFPFSDGLPRFNTSTVRGKVTVSLNSEDIALITDLYEQDFTRFNYPFPA